MSVMYQHVQGKAAVPIEVNPQLSKDLSDFIMKTMSVDKAKRPQSMEEFKSELARFK
jgi:serine/threonine-protein kinase